MRNKILWLLTFLLVCALYAPPRVHADDTFSAQVVRYPYHLPDDTVIGKPQWYTIRKKDTLLDVARHFGLGFNSIKLLYPHVDAWVPPVGKRLAIPTFWVLPPTKEQQLVINLPELRIYYFDSKTSTVQTYPIGIGDEGWETPLGTYYINAKRPHPTWYVPKSLQAKYGVASMPPGPDNPLGDFIMKFSAGAYGIHGTSIPWGVGRLVSHGCIRCYPEDIKILYPQVKIGTKLEIIYQPVKLGERDGQIYVQAFPDVYRKIPDYFQYAMDKLKDYPLAQKVDRKRYMMAIRLHNGVPVDVTKSSSPDISQIMIEMGEH